MSIDKKVIKGGIHYILIVVFFLVFFLYFQPVKVEGISMEPEIKEGENLIIEKIPYERDFKRGDIVIFHFPLNPEKIFIKRIIGLPGEVVEIQNGVVFINGKRLKEPYLKGKRDLSNYPPKKVPDGEYFVLGDNRIFSNDSRNWGFLPKKFIIGKAIFSY